MVRACCWVAIVAAAAGCAPLDGEGGAAPSDDDMLAAMRAAYLACSAYEDVGLVEVRQHRLGEAPTAAMDTAFRTAFARPDALRFQFWSRAAGSSSPWWSTHIVRAWGRDVRTSWIHDRDEEIEQSTSLRSATLGWYGISAATSDLILPLLLPDSLGDSLFIPDEVEAIGEAEVDGTPCYEIRGERRRWIDTSHITLRVGKDDMLLREVVDEGRVTHRVDTPPDDELLPWAEELEREQGDNPMSRHLRELARHPFRPYDQETTIRIHPRCGASIDARALDRDLRGDPAQLLDDVTAVLRVFSSGQP